MFEDNNLFNFLEKNVDESATVLAARRVLKNYTRIKSMANQNIEVSTSSISVTGHIKKQGSHSDIVGNAAARKIAAENELAEIEKALNSISSEYYKALMAKYNKKDHESDISLYINLGLSESTFYRYIREGQIQFAENYKNGKLLVFED